MEPIGYIKSPFQFKNGTPRQPTVCRQARGTLTIDRHVFNNPEHSLEGLGEFSHIWIIFIFHKNNNAYTKAKVRPPRLNGQKVGLFASRSPYRPNPIGATIDLSGIDLLDGTPVLDVKPYIPEYDSPQITEGHRVPDSRLQVMRATENSSETNDSQIPDPSEPIDSPVLGVESSQDIDSSDCPDTDWPADVLQQQSVNDVLQQQSAKGNCQKSKNLSESELSTTRTDSSCGTSASNSSGERSGFEKRRTQHTQKDRRIGGNGNHSGTCSPNQNASVAEWIENPPISRLCVRLTTTAEGQLSAFSDSCDDPQYRLRHLSGAREAREAITNILQEDPRSTYRRSHCPDALYYFAIDSIHVTCWFDADVAEVVRVQPVSHVNQCQLK
ncbi:hypothetical protein ScPMuIL_016517 [Solemya velum]